MTLLRPQMTEDRMPNATTLQNQGPGTFSRGVDFLSASTSHLGGGALVGQQATAHRWLDLCCDAQAIPPASLNFDIGRRPQTVRRTLPASPTSTAVSRSGGTKGAVPLLSRLSESSPPVGEPVAR